MAGLISAGSMAAISAGMTVAGAGAKAAGSLKGGQAAQASANYQAQVAKNNAIALRQMADRTISGGLVNADVSSMRGAARTSAIKAKQAASGIRINKGSAVDVRAGAAMASQFDAETVLRNADLQAYGYRVKADQEEAQSTAYTASGEQAKSAGEMGALTSMLGAASAIGPSLNTWAGGLGGGGEMGPPEPFGPGR